MTYAPIPDGALALNDHSEQLLRQVHPALLPGGVMSKTAFVPSESDKGMLSALREAVGAEEAHRRWTQDLGYESAGTWGITVGEAASGDLPAFDDSGCLEMPSDHASVDFRHLSTKGKILQAGRKLRDHATARGRLHP